MQNIERSEKAQEILSQIDEQTMLGQLRKIAKEINKDHALAMEIWLTGEYLPRLLAILIMDKQLLSPESINQLMAEMQSHPFEERTNLADWFMANQLVKSKKHIALIESWEKSSLVLQRRIFWYYQGRLRWTGKKIPDNCLIYLLKLRKISCKKSQKCSGR